MTVSRAPETAPIELCFCWALPLVVNGNTIALCGMAPTVSGIAPPQHIHCMICIYTSLLSPSKDHALSLPFSLLPSASPGALPYQVSLFLLSITPVITNYFAFLSMQPFDLSTPFVTTWIHYPRPGGSIRTKSGLARNCIFIMHANKWSSPVFTTPCMAGCTQWD